MEIVFATHNQHKTQEAKAIVGPNWTLKDLHEIGCHTDIPETADTLMGNALQKAQFVVGHYHMNCFADDTGLEIESLDGRPGVFSARYAGEKCSFADNVNKVLSEMKGMTNRKACFKTVIALILDGETYYFEGRVDGQITTEPHGEGGFGYDPIFLPDGYDKTFAELGMDVKNKISHRGRAMQKLMAFLNNGGK
ncbi:MAG: non-canonical purine NTP diphosphatase [Bacteroidales bacterium]|nr:non-canonical purine NTP diphosphatase [Bacteroidales bacterium]